MSNEIQTPKDARINAGKMASELKLAETTEDADEKMAALMLARVRCNRILAYLNDVL